MEQDLSKSDAVLALFLGSFTSSFLFYVRAYVTRIKKSRRFGLHKRIKTLLLTVLTVFCIFTLNFCTKMAISQNEHSYYPITHMVVNATQYISGGVGDLEFNDGSYMVFQSYPSQVSPQSLYAHQETITIGSAEYYVSSLDAADAAGTNLSAPLSSTGRKLLGEFIYPLTGITSIPASTWTIYYRAWISNMSEEILINSPSWFPQALWGNAEYAYSPDDTYAYSSNPGVTQEYGNYWFNLPSTANIIKVEVGYEAFTEGDERITVALSWDGGAQWTAEYVSPPLGTMDLDKVNWVDFTAAASWNASMLSDANFRCRVSVFKVGSQTDEVFLDWLPVRVTYVGNPPSAHMDVDVRIRRSNGAIRQTLAIEVANSESLSTTAQTLAATYEWQGYIVADQTDYLEIDYYVDVLNAYTGAVAHLITDDATLLIEDQTRVANIMLPSEYTVEVEFSGYSDTAEWSEIVWTVDASWTTNNVLVTLQLYNYQLGAYPISGDGYIAFLSSSVSDTDETKTQTIMTNTTNFKDYLGNWKMKIKGVKPATLPFNLKLDLCTFQVTHIVHHDIALLSVTYSPTSIYQGDMVTINVTVKNDGETSESFNVTAYYDDNQIGKQIITNLMPSESINVTFKWNTTVTTPGSFILKAVADTVPNEDDTVDNIFIYGLVMVKGQPIAFFTHIPETPTVGETVTFNASLSVSEGSLITSYEWNFGDGNITVTSSSIITHTYVNVGNHTVILNITNSDGLWSTYSKTISIGLQPEGVTTPWNWIWALLIPLLLILLFVGLGWKKRKSKPNYAGIEFLNEITEGGIPDSFSVMLLGSSDPGKSLLLQELAHEFLKKEKPCIYVVYECFPDEIRENMRKYQWDTSTYESQGKLSFIDCFSSNAKVQSKERYFLNQPFSLVDLGITLSKATGEAGNGVKVFFDSLVPLLTQLDPTRVVDFLQDRIARIKGVQGNLLFTLNKESVDPTLTSRFEEIVDCVIELYTDQVNGETVRKLRIKKMRGRNFSDRWVWFEINPKKGIIFRI